MFSKQFAIMGMVVCAIMAFSVPAAWAAYVNGPATWDIDADIDTQLGISYGGIPAGTGVHFDLAGTAGVTFANATATSVDLAMNSLNLSGMMSIVGGPSYPATATLYTPAGSPTLPTGNVGQLNLSPAGSYFYPFVKLSIPAVGLTAYSGLNTSHGGSKATALKQEAQTNSSLGLGTYSNTRVVDWMQAADGTGITFFTPTIGSVWTVTPEPATLVLLGLALPFLRRRTGA